MSLGLKITDIEVTKDELVTNGSETTEVGTNDVSGMNYTTSIENRPVNNSEVKSQELLHFTEEILPDPIRRWTLDNCNQAEGSLNYGAVSAIMVISSAIGYHVRVSPKNHGNWRLVPNLWGMLIGNPSDRKSPVADQFIKPLSMLEKDANDTYKEEISEYKEKEKHRDYAQKAQDKALKAAYESEDNTAIQKASNMQVPNIGEEPVRERFIIIDGSTESIGEIASQSTRTLLQYRDELSGFFSALNKQGKEGDRSFYLEAYAGDRSYSYDRISRGNIMIDRLSLGLFGTIQPTELAKHVVSKDGKTHDGLAQRMQLSVFSDGIYKPYTDEPIDKEARDSAYDIIKTLAYADFEMWGACNDENDEIPYFKFNHEAQQLFIEWYNQTKNKEQAEVNLNMQAHIGKYYSLLPSLALIFFLIDKAADDTTANAIEVSHFRLAERWCEILESHARKMYGLAVVEPTVTLAEKIVRWVEDHPEKLPATFGAISGDIRGAKAEDVALALKNIAEIDGKNVVRLLSNVQLSENSK